MSEPSSQSAIQTTTVTILDRDIQVACPPEEQAGLIASAALLDKRMREVRKGLKSASADRVAIMAALNLTHELITERSQRETIDIQVSVLNNKLDAALGNDE